MTTIALGVQVLKLSSKNLIYCKSKMAKCFEINVEDRYRILVECLEFTPTSAIFQPDFEEVRVFQYLN